MTRLIPKIGATFALTLKKFPDPMEMLRGNGYGCDPTGWSYTGKRGIVGTKRFKLVQAENYGRNIAELRQYLGEESIPDGVWREAFERMFPFNDGRGPIGFADPSWIAPDGESILFPVLYGTNPGWVKYFDHVSADDTREGWRWLVEIKS